MREIVEAIFYLLRAGCPWRLLPDSFPPWRTVYQWFCTLRDDGVFESLNHHLVRIDRIRSEEHTSELQSLMRISYAVFCLKKKNHAHKGTQTNHDTYNHTHIRTQLPH